MPRIVSEERETSGEVANGGNRSGAGSPPVRSRGHAIPCPVSPQSPPVILSCSPLWDPTEQLDHSPDDLVHTRHNGPEYEDPESELEPEAHGDTP